MAKKCLECKYYKYEEGSTLNRCKMDGRYKRPNQTCEDYTDIREETKSNITLEELESRVSNLERLVMRIL